MIISDLNILETVESVNVIGGYNGKRYGKKAKGYGKKAKGYDKSYVEVDLFVPVDVEQYARNYSKIESEDFSENEVEQENKQKSDVYLVFENIGNITKVLGY